MMTGLSAMLRIVALLDGGVERVAIDMGEGQRGQRVVADQARRAACAASPGREIEIAEAVPAKAGRPVAIWRGGAHGTSRSQSGSPSAWRAAAILVGMKLRGARERLHGCVIAQHEIEHAGEKMRVGGGRAQGLRADPALGQKQAQPLGIAGDKGKRLNRHDFSYFAGVVSRLCHRRCLPFRNLWSLFWSHHARVSERVQASGNRVAVKMRLGLNGLERILALV